MNQSVRNGSVSDWWWLGVVAGVATILFGIAALFWPGLTLVTFVYLFSAFVLVWGLVSIVKSLVHMQGMTGMWWLAMLFGVAALGVGVYLVRHPDVAFTTLVLLVGFTLIVRGVFDVVEGLFGRQTGNGKVLAMVAGAVGVVAGIFMLMQPADGGVAFVWILGLYALVLGPLLIAMTVDERDAVPVRRG